MIKNINMLNNAWLLLVLSIFLQSFSFLSIKYATLTNGIYALVYLLIAIFFILFRAWIWQIVLKNFSLSKAYPFASLVQILIFIYAVVFFHETIMPHHFMGLLIMLTGLALIAKGQ
jgi:multidrug transporter EmrE-like cation transporter